jgi:hypothetical protein
MKPTLLLSFCSLFLLAADALGQPNPVGVFAEVSQTSVTEGGGFVITVHANATQTFDYLVRLARQNELLKRLRGASEKPNITHLAGEFRVSRKTILRDLHDLIQRGQLDESVYPDWKSEREA